MKIVSEHPNYIVIDEFMDSSSHEELWKYCQADEYKVVNREKWSKVWHTGDGNPMYGSIVLSNNNVEEHLIATKGYQKGGYRVCPTGDIVDEFLGKLDSVIPRLSSIIGKSGESWLGTTFKPYIYPEGCGLSWHQDGSYSGAFIFYVNPIWKASWGGELLLAQHAPGADLKLSHTFSDGREVLIGGHLDSTKEDSVLLEKGMGNYVMPKPNRLVVLGGGIAHKINRVSIGESSQPRVSCSGFFIKK